MRMSKPLSREQLQRMEENRKRALELRAEKAKLSRLNDVIPVNTRPQDTNKTQTGLKPASVLKVTNGSYVTTTNSTSNNHMTTSLGSISGSLGSLKSDHRCLPVTSSCAVSGGISLKMCGAASNQFQTLRDCPSKPALKVTCQLNSVDGGSKTLQHSSICNSSTNRAQTSSSLSSKSTNRTQTSSSLSSKSTNQAQTSSSLSSKPVNAAVNKTSFKQKNNGYVKPMVPPKSLDAHKFFGHKNMTGVCRLMSRDRFQVDVSYCQPLVDFFKLSSTGKYDPTSKLWDFSMSEYNKIIIGANQLKPDIVLEPLPKWVLKIFRLQVKGHLSPGVSIEIPQVDLSPLGEKLVSSLRPFQRTGINFGIWNGGRVLIADDMGLGKTIQAIGIASYYRDEWPLLIVVPSSVRFAWAEQLRTWLPKLDPQEINVVTSGRDPLSSGLVNILSYDIMARKGKELLAAQFKVIIFDESHFLKNFKTARCTSALPLAKMAHRVILLSGTPALSRPVELYTQVQAVDPSLFTTFHAFGIRYCEGKKNAFGWDFQGSSNMTELQVLLQESILIRRLKKDVLSQLPDKIRHLVLLDPQSIKIDKTLKSGVQLLKSDSTKLKGAARHSFLLENFSHTASSKAKAVRDYIFDLLESDRKLLVFGHHQMVLNTIETMAIDKKYGYIRIDGTTPSEVRNRYCTKFQNEAGTRLAILSITAANVGLNLTAANLVVFAELYWTPGVLMQAEDRAHRIGQKDSVTVHYLLARGTVDDVLWSMVKDKLAVLGDVGLYRDDFSDATTTCLKSNKADIASYFKNEDDLTAAMFDEDDDILWDTDHSETSSENFAANLAQVDDLTTRSVPSNVTETKTVEELSENLQFCEEDFLNNDLGDEQFFLPPLKKSKT